MKPKDSTSEEPIEPDALRAMLDSRYDEAMGGTAVLIDGDEVFAELMARTAAERKRRDNL